MLIKSFFVWQVYLANFDGLVLQYVLWSAMASNGGDHDLVVLVKYRKKRKGEDSEGDDDITLTVEERKRPLYRRLIDPRYWTYRCTIQFTIAYLLFAIQYCFECPGGIEDTIIKVMQVDTTQYSLLFSVASWPSVILCLIGGPLTDRVLGRRTSIALYTVIITIGQLIWALGAFVSTYWIMLIGRFLIGVGIMILTAVLKSCTVLWFKDKGLAAFALSTGVTAARFGGSAGLSIPQLIYGYLDSITNTHIRLGVTILSGGIIMVIGFLLMLLLIAMDIRGERLLKREEQKVTLKIKCSELKQFSFGFWIVTFICAIYYPVIFSFTSIGEVFYIQKYGLSLSTSGFVVSLAYSATFLLTPLMGLLVDMIGYHVIWVVSGLMTALLAHLLLLTSNGHYIVPYISGVIYSSSYTIISASLWALPGLMIDTSQVATAYSIIFSPYMLLLAILSLVSGSIIDNAGYFILEACYSLLLYMSLLAALLLWFSDGISKGKSLVNGPGKLTNKIKEKVRIGIQNLKQNNILFKC